jgi:hypothetical protein
VIAQLEMVPLPGRPTRGQQLVGLRISGDPVPWARPKPFILAKNTPNERIVERFTGPYAAWRTKAIREVARWWGGKPGIRVPVVVEVVAVQARPDRPPRATVGGELVAYPWVWTDGRNPSLGMGDADNFAKGVLDCLQQVPPPIGLERQLTAVLVDDRLSIHTTGRRVYAAVGEEPCTEVRIWSAA